MENMKVAPGVETLDHKAIGQESLAPQTTHHATAEQISVAVTTGTAVPS